MDLEGHRGWTPTPPLSWPNFVISHSFGKFWPNNSNLAHRPPPLALGLALPFWEILYPLLMDNYIITKTSRHVDSHTFTSNSPRFSKMYKGWSVSSSLNGSLQWILIGWITQITALKDSIHGDVSVWYWLIDATVFETHWDAFNRVSQLGNSANIVWNVSLWLLFK